MNKLSLKDLTFQTLIASIYVVLVIIPFFTIISFNAIQFRVAEVLMILMLFSKKHQLGLVIGCFIANLVGMSLGLTNIFDVIFGTLATLITANLMYIFRKTYLISLLFPAIINGLIVGSVLSFLLDLNIFLSIIYVFIGEFLVLYLLGLPIYLIINKREDIKEILS